MDMVFIIVIGFGVLIFGSMIAAWWWRLARRIAPYTDELPKPGDAPASTSSEEVIIMNGSGPSSGDSGRVAHEGTKPRV